MRRLLTAAQAFELDQRTQQNPSLSAEVLMERAGLKVAQRILADYPQAEKIGVVVGPGHNGGDGLVVARHLVKNKKSVTVVAPKGGVTELWIQKKKELFLCEEPFVWLEGEELKRIQTHLKSQFPGQSTGQFPDQFPGQWTGQCPAQSPPRGPSSRLSGSLSFSALSERTDLTDVTYLTTETNQNLFWDLFVDAAFGIGLERPLSEDWIDILNCWSRNSRWRVAVDIASGLDASTGRVLNFAPKVDRTYTLGVCKLGLVVGDGPSVSGQVAILDIGFSPSVLKEMVPQIRYFGKRAACRYLPSPDQDEINKSDRGHLLVVGGSQGMEGAAALAALAGARMGAGYVTEAQWAEAQWAEAQWAAADKWAVASERPAATERPVADERQTGAPCPRHWGAFVQSGSPVILRRPLDVELAFLESMKRPTAIVLGPGLGLEARSRKLVQKLTQRFRETPLVIDADALHHLKALDLFPVPQHWILTPHTGELSRLLDISVDDIKAHRFEALQRAQEKLGGTILLKGYRSLISPDPRHFFVVGSGCAALAKAGTGDVLAGMLGGLLASGLPPLRALLLGTYVHGRLGDCYRKKWKHGFSLLATDLIDTLPEVLKELYEVRTH